MPALDRTGRPQRRASRATCRSARSRRSGVAHEHRAVTRGLPYTSATTSRRSQPRPGDDARRGDRRRHATLLPIRSTTPCTSRTAPPSHRCSGVRNKSGAGASGVTLSGLPGRRSSSGRAGQASAGRRRARAVRPAPQTVLPLEIADTARGPMSVLQQAPIRQAPQRGLTDAAWSRCARARDAEGRRVHRRRPRKAADRRRRRVDRTMPCNLNQRRSRATSKRGHPRRRRDADGVEHDLDLRRVSMGTSGMRASLVSREVIADSIELVAAATSSTASCASSAATRRFPRGVMALARLDLPGLILYSGSIEAGRYKGKDVTIQDVFEVGRQARRRARRPTARCTPSRASRARARARAAATSPRTRWRPRSTSSA